MSKHNILTFETNRLIKQKYKHTKKGIWKTLVELCNPSRRRTITVNLSKIARYTVDSKIAVVPGKVLGFGRINMPLTVAALSFSLASSSTWSLSMEILDNKRLDSAFIHYTESVNIVLYRICL